MINPVTVSSQDEQTRVTQNQEGHIIWMAHGNDDHEPVELLHDILEYVEGAGKIDVALRDYARTLRQLLVDVDMDLDGKILA